jgi:deoxyribodipyrimidine photo-lyase
METVNVIWFRRDLRLHDQTALHHALRSGKPVLPIFIFDTSILDLLADKSDARVQFIWQALHQMQEKLVQWGSSMTVFYGRPLEVFASLTRNYSIETVFTNHDYDPAAILRDQAVSALLQERGIQFLTFKDQVIFEKAEVVKDDGSPYTVFTPYSKKWKSKLQPSSFQAFDCDLPDAYRKQSPQPIPTLEQMGFKPVDIQYPEPGVEAELLSNYGSRRDFPALEATSKLGVHLRFGTISIRALARQSAALSEVFLNELIWRDFYHMILWHFPQVGKGKAFKPIYDQIQWRNQESEFAAWCAGETGYPIVDAGMRELNATGFMHNRVRMIAASFLTKHLLIDWRWGEAYFAAKLLDFDLAANNGGWQWAAGSGCDAAPYFRIFNPALQTQKFDPKGTYIRKWVPEIDSLTYTKPIVQHEWARKRCLEVYAKALKG